MRYIIVLLKSKFKINSYGLKHGVDFEVVKGTGIIFAVVFLLFLTSLYAAEYYVDIENGDDVNPGTVEAPLKYHPWMSNFKGSITLEPGDTVYMKGGCVWRDTIKAKASGIEDAPIITTSYGKGFATISGMRSGNWSHYEDTIWIDDNFPSKPYHVWEDNSMMAKIDKIENMMPGSWYYDEENNALYVWTFENDNPNNHCIEIEAAYFCIDTNEKTHLIFNHLNLVGAKSADVYVRKSSSNITIQRCFISLGYRGIFLDTNTSDVNILNCTIANNYKYGVFNKGCESCFIINSIIIGTLISYGIGGSGYVYCSHCDFFANHYKDIDENVIDDGTNFFTDPGFAKIGAEKGIITFSIDDWGGAYYADNISQIFDNYGEHLTFYVNTKDASPIIPILQDLYSRGHDVGGHTVNHSHLTQLDAFTVQYTGSASYCNLSISDDFLILDSENDDEDHILDLNSKNYNTIGKLVNTIDNFSNYTASLITDEGRKSFCLDDHTNQDIKTPVTVKLDEIQFCDSEIQGCKEWLEKNIGGDYVAKSFAYPYSSLNDTTIERVKVAGFVVARDGHRIPSFLSNLNIFDLYCVGLGSNPEEVPFSKIDGIIWLAKSWGMWLSILSHCYEPWSSEQIEYLLQQCENKNIPVMSQAEGADYIRNTSNESPNSIIFSKKIIFNPDYRLRPNSACIDSGMDIGLPYYGSAPDIGADEFMGPIPDIKANNLDGPITLSQSDTAVITVTLDNNGRTDNADWWLAADTPFGLYFFTFDGWTTDWAPGYQGPLFHLAPFEVLNIPISGLPAGTYTLYFGVDTNMDDNVNWDCVYYDTVTVNITE